jgi:hypothetical protein
MKKIIFVFTFFTTMQFFSQENLGRPFITASLHATLGINEDYVLFDNNTDDEVLLEPSALFFRTGFGYEFKRTVAISFNAGFDYHWNYATSAFPTYGTVKYNIFEFDDDAFFVESSFGKMWRPSNRYPDGNYYGFGIGLQIAGEKRWHSIVRLDFHRKGIKGFRNNRIDSVSFGFGFSFF